MWTWCVYLDLITGARPLPDGRHPQQTLGRFLFHGRYAGRYAKRPHRKRGKIPAAFGPVPTQQTAATCAVLPARFA